jgi:NADPH-dependent 2,4-dienoyl-CoA reductase/sulfur reductase-like enzyme
VTAVVVGASVAGVRTAQALRREGFGDDIVLIGAEPDVPYDKPPLSKAALAGTTTLDAIALLTHDDAKALGVELRLGVPAAGLDVPNRSVQLADGSTVSYDQVVLATGTRARPSPWEAGSRLHLLRTAADCARLRAAMQSARSILVIGAGFIGSEVAATATKLGLSVTMVDPLPIPMSRIVGAEMGELLASVHDGYDVERRFGVGVDRVVDDGGQLTVELTDGSQVRADLAVVGIGAVPNSEWLEDSGLAIDNGVMCDEFCRAEGRDDVFAAGDIARWLHLRHGEHRRVEHWTHACEQAAAVAHNICHPDDLRAYDPVDYVWSDQYEWRIQMVGHTAEDATPVIVGDISAGRCAAVYGDPAGQLTGAVTVSWPKAMLAVRRLLTAGGATAAEALAQINKLAAPVG